MPLVRIDLATGKPADHRRAIGDAIHDAMVATIGIPADDRFQVITEHAAGDLVFDPGYLGIARSADCVFVQITISTGRTIDVRKSLFLAIADALHAKVGLRREDVLVNLVEVAKENWSFGNGIAQYAT
jgi:phenylpyruvate tautomerase PptA (4-oxalocrotonate tautomerase family)